MTVSDVVARLQHVVMELTNDMRYMPFTEEENTRYVYYLTRILERNDKMLDNMDKR